MLWRLFSMNNISRKNIFLISPTFWKGSWRNLKQINGGFRLIWLWNSLMETNWGTSSWTKFWSRNANYFRGFEAVPYTVKKVGIVFINGKFKPRRFEWRADHPSSDSTWSQWKTLLGVGHVSLLDWWVIVRGGRHWWVCLGWRAAGLGLRVVAKSDT